MTLFIPDISHHQEGISLQQMWNEGYRALFARVGQGAGTRRDGHKYGTTKDRMWPSFHKGAKRLGFVLMPYWYVGNNISPDENARLAKEWVLDPTLPWMLDHEDASGDIAYYHKVKDAFKRAGLKVVVGYVPHWYWNAVGGGSLIPGPPIDNSRYSNATGTPDQIYKAAGGAKGNGWINFGGGTTKLWQFTNQALIAGRKIDCNAFEGTLTEFILEIIGGSSAVVDTTSKKRYYLNQH